MEAVEKKILVYQIVFREPYCSKGPGEEFIIPIKIPSEHKGCVAVFPGGYTGRVEVISKDYSVIKPDSDEVLSVGIGQSIAIFPKTQKPKHSWDF